MNVLLSQTALVMHPALIRHSLNGQFIVISKPAGLEKDQDGSLVCSVTSPLGVGCTFRDLDLEIQTSVTLPYFISFLFDPSLCSVN